MSETKTNVTFGDEVSEKFLNGIDKAANAVRQTIGAKGRNVAIEGFQGNFRITNDGVTVVRSIDLEDRIENMGVTALKEAASQTESEAGDGTSATSILLQSMLKNGIRHVRAGANPMDLKRGMAKTVEALVEVVDQYSVDISTNNKKIKEVATVSANNDPVLGAIISEAIEKVGPMGTITVEDSDNAETKIEVVEGLEFNRGWIHPFFSRDNGRGETIVMEPVVLITDKKLHNSKELIPALELAMSSFEGRPILIISDDVDQSVQQFILKNNYEGHFAVICVKAPEVGDTRLDVLTDIAIVTGGKVISDVDNTTFANMTAEMFGHASKVIVTRESTTISNGLGDSEEIQKRIDSIALSLETEKDKYIKSKLEQRAAKLSGGVAQLLVGAYTDIELNEKKLRIDDALAATKAAIAEGIVPGGGVTLLFAAKVLEEAKANEDFNPDEKLGYLTVMESVKEPFMQILKNAGKSGEVNYEKIISKKFPFGYNVNDDQIVNMFNAGIIDPAKVIKSALRNSCSAASMILTTNVAVTNLND